MKRDAVREEARMGLALKREEAVMLSYLRGGISMKEGGGGKDGEHA